MRSKRAFATKDARRNMVGVSRNARAIADVPTRNRVCTGTYGAAMGKEAIRAAAAPTGTGTVALAWTLGTRRRGSRVEAACRSGDDAPPDSPSRPEIGWLEACVRATFAVPIPK
jgi:hypothetical protein